MTVFFENPETGPKIRIFFYFVQKTLLVNYFQKYCLKVPASLIFCEICESWKYRLILPEHQIMADGISAQFQHASTES